MMPPIPIKQTPIPPTVVTEPERYSKARILSLAFLALIVLGLLVYGAYKVFDNYRMINSDDPASVIAAVGKLAALPEGETPTVATITTLEPLKNQPFFKDAEIGDKVLIFNTSKKAILYRPSQNKVITIAPLSQ